MPGMKAHFVKLLLQNRHLMQFKLRKELVDWNKYESILRFRQEVKDGAAKFGKLPAGMVVSTEKTNDLLVEWILPPQGTKDKVILYFHGGGYISGTCRDHRSIVSKFVNGSGVGALLFEYRLAPEHPYPAALDDAVAAYQWLLVQGLSPANIVFMGDSAGGGLYLATLLALRDQGIPLPAAAVALSPWTDLKCSGESHRSKEKVCLSPVGSAEAFAKHYAADNDPGLPYISPLYGDLHGMPPMLIYVGEDETLRDDSIMYATKAKDAGVDITIKVGEGLFHCYPATAPLFPEAQEALEDICNFIRRHIHKD